MRRVLLALTGLGLLSACGVQGGLERPDPLWNREEAIRRECAAQSENGRPRDPRCAQYETAVEDPAPSAPSTPTP